MPVLTSPAGCSSISEACNQLLGGFPKERYSIHTPLPWQSNDQLLSLQIGNTSALWSQSDLSCSCLNVVTTPSMSCPLQAVKLCPGFSYQDSAFHSVSRLSGCCERPLLHCAKQVLCVQPGTAGVTLPQPATLSGL